MADGTKIEWTDASWSPIRARYWQIQNDGSGKERIGWHCEHVSEGCRHCYAERINIRLGTGQDYAPDELYREKWKGYRNGEVKLFLDDKMLTQPLRWRQPRKIFVCSMTDLFADFVPDDWIDRVFAVMALSPQHTFQVLTKRAERMRDYFAAFSDDHWLPPRLIDAANFMPAPRAPDEPPEWPLPNVWLGVSVEDQQRADERIPLLLDTPAAKRFISAEPLLSGLDIRRWLDPTGIRCPDVDPDTKYLLPEEISYFQSPGAAEVRPLCPGCGQLATATGYDPGLDWVIVGGESGPNARPMHPDWAGPLRDQCTAAGVAFFYKQHGEWTPDITPHIPVPLDHLRHVRDDGRVATAAEADDIERREGHQNWKQIARVGKAKAGRLLDGRSWDEFPA